MYYVVRKGTKLVDYHSAFYTQGAAIEYAESLKLTLGHDYDVIKVATVWSTQPL